jgi:hypothetical protein
MNRTEPKSVGVEKHRATGNREEWNVFTGLLSGSGRGDGLPRYDDARIPELFLLDGCVSSPNAYARHVS